MKGHNIANARVVTTFLNIYKYISHQSVDSK